MLLQAAGREGRQGLTGGKRLRLELFLFVLLKCYIDDAAFNYLGGGVHLYRAVLSQLKLGALTAAFCGEPG